MNEKKKVIFKPCIITISIVILLLMLMLLTAIICIVKNYAATDNGKIKIFRIGFLGMSSYGNPVEKLAPVISLINSHKTGKDWAAPKLILNYAKTNQYLIYYSCKAEGFQISYWSGETTWVYDSESNAYYEFDEDIINSAWYDVKSKRHFSPDEARKVGIVYTKLR